MPIHNIPGAIRPEEYNFDAEWSSKLNATTFISRDGRSLGDRSQHLDNVKMDPAKIAGLALAYQDLIKRYQALERECHQLRSHLERYELKRSPVHG